MQLGTAAASAEVRPWGWRILGKAAHYFERVAINGSPPYASRSSLCGRAQVGRAREPWLVHPHAGQIPLCSKCCERLTEVR